MTDYQTFNARGKVDAYQLEKDEVISTSNGPVQGYEGDYVVKDPHSGGTYIEDRDTFDRTYDTGRDPDEEAWEEAKNVPEESPDKTFADFSDPDVNAPRNDPTPPSDADSTPVSDTPIHDAPPSDADSTPVSDTPIHDAVAKTTPRKGVTKK